MDNKQIEMMVCPECNGKLEFNKTDNELTCNSCQIAFPVKDGIPVMLIEEARRLAKEQ